MKKLMIASAAVLMGTAAYAQSAIDGYRLSQQDLKGTARYMSMAGAFGALGGDLSTLSHNPGGIGVYRNSEVGLTLDLDLQHAESTSGNLTNGINQTKFLLNNIGFVWTMKLPSSTCPNFNIGFTYNKNASFNRRYRGAINLTNSLSNYAAGQATKYGYSTQQLLGGGVIGPNPYMPQDGYGADWLSILGYDGYMFASQPVNGAPNYVGQWDNWTDMSGQSYQTSGLGLFDVRESGGIDSYNIALGGNIANVLFWGMDFDITHINYTLTPDWTEVLQNAGVGMDDNEIYLMPSNWKLSNFYNCSGTGFNYKLGFIFKPVQEFRLGFAFETPTWYGLNESFDAALYGQYGDYPTVDVYTNDGMMGTNQVNFRTPWKINASAAAVLFNRLIVSAEYEWTQFKGMRYSTPDYWNSGYWYDDYYPGYGPYDNGYFGGFDYDQYVTDPTILAANSNIQNYYVNTNTLRLGAEFRLTPQFSVRAGYSYVSAPMKDEMNRSVVETVGTIPNYRVDSSTNYVTCGLGYKIQKFYIDLAYVYKHFNSTYHAFSPWFPDDYTPGHSAIPSQTSSLSLNNSQIVLSAGFKF